MNKNQQLIENFYNSFSKGDAKGMIDCYHNQIEFKDPAFGTLKADKAKAMWEMLCQNANELQIQLISADASGNQGVAEWHADYVFGKTNRAVKNIIHAKFEFADGKIIKHVDSFNLRKWAGQAMGIKGKILGGTRFFRERLQEQINLMLKKYMGQKG